MKLFLDTNIWLRYFIGDDSKHLEITTRIFQMVDEGKIIIATSSFILSEFIHVETTFYKISRKNIIEDLQAIRSMRNIWLVEKLDFNAGFAIYNDKLNRNIRWSDCVIMSQVPKSYRLCSFDKRLEKPIGKDRFIDPKEIIS